MVAISLILFAASLLCLVMASRGLSALMFAAAAGFYLLPQLAGEALGTAEPRGFAAAAQPAAAPAVTFKAANGRRMSLADFRGRVVLLNIWATWCVPCRSEMPSLDRLQELHAADGLAVLAVSVDDDGANAVRRFYQQSGIRNLPVYIDSARTTQSAFGARAIPMTVLIDRDGNVVGKMTGATAWDAPEALALVRRYLDG
jgi:thiol-disulfide isomerase/thioredoxin